MKRYKAIIAFFLKCFLGAMPLFVLIAYTSLCPLNFMDGEYPAWKQQKDFVLKGIDDYDILVLGDSRTKAGFIPAQISENMYSLALGGATSLEMYYSMENYLNNHGTIPSTVFISLAPFHLMIEDCFWVRTMYFHYLNYKQQKEVFQLAKKYQDPFICIPNYVKEMISYQGYLPNKYVTALLNSGFTERRECNKMVYNTMDENRGHAYFGLAEENSEHFVEAEWSDFQPLSMQTYYLKRLIELLEKNKIKVIIEQTPVNKATYMDMNILVRDKIEEYYRELAKEYPSITVNSRMLYYENEYFGDAAHLNPRGAKKFSEDINNKYKL